MATKNIKTFEAACKAQGLDPKTVLPDVSCLPEMDRKAVTALAKMCIIQRTLNGDWKPDWSDSNQPKYYPWYDIEEKEDSPSGFALSYDDCAYGRSASNLGARLFYKDRETARYAFETFTELYEDMVLIPK